MNQRKLFGIGLVLVMIVVVCLGVVAAQPLARTTEASDPPCTCGDICVNTTGWWPAGGTFNASSTPIQDAVDNATSGDTICVRDGTYHENVYVNIANLTIKSENGSANCVVSASNSSTHVFHVTADWVNITGFTVKDATAAVGIYLHEAKHCNISDNNILDNEGGILLDYSSNNTVTNNNVNSNNVDGIRLNESSGNEITGNNVWNNECGIDLEYSSDTAIMDNNVSNNDLGIDIELSSSNNTLTNNTASNSTHHGIKLSSSSNNMLTNNTVLNNDISGIWLLFSSNNNTLTNNTANLNTHHGIFLDSSSNNTLTNNTASNNGERINLWYSSNNTLTNNTMCDNHCNFGVHGDEFSHFNQNVDTSNKVNEKPIQYLIDKENLVIDSSWSMGYLGLLNCTNITVHDLNMTNNGQGVLLAYSDNSEISNVTALDDTIGIHLQGSSNNTLTNNTALNNVLGIGLGSSSNNNTVTNNTVNSNTVWGILLAESSSNNLIYNNYFSNTNNAYDDGNNTWNTTKQAGTNIIGGPYLGGNYWSDYAGSDTDGDGLGNTLLPYNCTGNITNGGDHLPLVPPPPPPVGGTVYPVNKLAILAPWIVLLAAIIAGASVLMLKRRRTSDCHVRQLTDSQ